MSASRNQPDIGQPADARRSDARAKPVISAAGAIRRSSEELQRIADAVPALIGYLGADLRFRFTNKTYETWFGYTRAQMSGLHLREVIGEGAFAVVEDQVRAVLAGREATYERWMPYARGGRRFVHAILTPRTGPDGAVQGFDVLITDITARKRAEERNQFLAAVSEVLAGSLDDEQTLARMAQMAVPDLATWCAVDIVDEDGRPRRLAVTHADPDTLAQLEQSIAHHPPNAELDYGMHRVLRTGCAEMVPHVTDELLRQAARDEEHLALLRRLNLTSYMCVPLLARGRLLGVLSLGQTDSERDYTAEDLAFAETLAHRAALFVDNARLYRAAQREIAQRAAAETALRASAQRFEHFFHTAMAMWIEDFSGAQAALGAWRAQGVTDIQAHLKAHPEFVKQLFSTVRIVDINEAAVELFQASDAQTLRSELEHRGMPQLGGVAHAEMLALAEGRPYISAESHIQTLAGERRDVLLRVAFPAPGGDYSRVLVSVVDITARRRGERRARLLADAGAILAASTDHNTTLNEIARLVVVALADMAVIDLLHDGALQRVALAHGRRTRPAAIEAWSCAYAASTSDIPGPARVALRARAEFIADTARAVVGEPARERAYRGTLAAHGADSYVCVPVGLRDQVIGTLTLIYAGSMRRFVHDDLLFAEELARRVAVALDNARLYRAAQREIAERAAAEQALLESRERLQLALAAGHMGTWSGEIGANGRLAWSPEGAVVLGVRPEELTSTADGFYERVHPEDQPRVRATIEHAVDTRRDFALEFRFLPGAGPMRWVEIRGRPYLDAGGKPRYVAGVALDITERKLAEQALKASEARFQAVFLNALDAILLADSNGRYVDANPAACALLGYTRTEFLTLSVADITSPAHHERMVERWHAFVASGEQTGEYALRRKDGADIFVTYRAVANILPGLHLSVLIDVTERKRAQASLEARVRQQEAVARLGHAALETDDVQSLLDTAVELLAHTLDADYAKVLELVADGQALMLRAGVGWQAGLVGQATVDAGLDSQAGYTLSVNGPVVVTDLRSETRFRGPPLLHEHGVVSGMSVPIAGADHGAYGVLGVHTRVARTFTPEDVNFLQAVSHVLAAAIQRRRVTQALEQAHNELEQRVLERTAELAKANETLRDEIVDRMGVESALRESEAQYRLLFERNPLPAWVFDLTTRDILAANETAVWRYGYSRDEFLRMAIDDLHPPEELAQALDYAEKFPPETAYVGTSRHRKQDDTIIDVELFVYEVLFRGRWARLVLANDITERKRAEEEVRLIETVTRAIGESADLDAALQGVLKNLCHATGWLMGEAWVPGGDGTYLEQSPAGYSVADGFEEFTSTSANLKVERGSRGLIGRAWSSRQPAWITDVTLDSNFRRIDAARAVGIRAGASFPVFAGDEVVVVLAFFMREQRREDERQVKLVSAMAAHVGLAIQRKRAEEALRESEERFRVMVEGAQDYGFYMLDLDGRIVSWNLGAQRTKGYTAEEIIGRHFDCFYPDEDKRAGLPQRALDRAVVDGSFEGEGWRLRKDGTRFWANVVITPLRDASGGLRGFVKLVRDTSERKQAEQRLRESEARLARAQEFSSLLVAHAELDGRWRKVPAALCTLLDYGEGEMLAGRFKDVTHPDDFEAEWALCQRLIRGEAKAFDLEKRFVRRDGKVLWMYQNTSIVLDADDRPLHFLTFLRDITQRKEAEEQLYKNRLQLLEAQRLAHMGSWEWDISAGNVEWSDELYRIYGLEPGTPVNYEGYLGRIHPDDRERVYGVVARALKAREPFTFEERILRPDGEVRHLLSQGAVIANDRDEPERILGVCLDITERKHAEERLREYAARLATLSQRLLEAQETERRRIARELHDQIGQDLSVIKINLQAMQRLPGRATAGPHLEETLRIVEHVLSTARNLSLELRPSMLDDLGLTAALRWYLDRQAQRAGFSVQLHAETLDTRIPSTIETACFRVAQEAVTNIMRHAHAKRVEVELVRHDGELKMHIRDDGKGFDLSAAKAHAGQGVSFGLLGMEERALLAGGRLEISSTPGLGTEITACFPLRDGAT